MAERAVAPGDCALAIALPLTEGEFLADFEETETKDFARSLGTEGTMTSPMDIWHDEYKGLARLGREVLTDTAALGATTAPRVTLAAFADLVSRFHVVTLFAHAPFVEFVADDIVAPATLLDRVGREPGAVTTHLRKHFERHAAQLLDAGSVAARAITDLEGLKEEVAQQLNDVIEPTRELYAMTATEAFRYRDPSRPARDPSAPKMPRGRIEEEFPDEIRPGPAIELADGLMTARDFIAAIPTNFDGVLDLSSCNSVTLGEAIKRRRHDCLVVINERLTPLGFRLASYRMVLREIAKTPHRERYTDTLIRVRKGLAGAKEMNTLASILQEFTGATVLGPRNRPAATNLAARKRLSARLKDASHANDRYLMICVGMIVVVFGASLWVILSRTSQPATVAATITALGVTTGGIIRMMIGLWREKSAMDLLLAMTEEADAKVLEAVVSIVKTRLLGPSKGGPRTATPPGESDEPSGETAKDLENPSPPSTGAAPRLSDATLRAVHAAALSTGLSDNQDTLLRDSDPTIVQGLPPGANPADRLLSTLHILNGLVLDGGAIPLRAWLSNAEVLAGKRRERRVFQAALGELDGSR